MRSFSFVAISYDTRISLDWRCVEGCHSSSSPLVRLLPFRSPMAFPQIRLNEYLRVYWEFYSLSLSISSRSLACFPICSHFQGSFWIFLKCCHLSAWVLKPPLQSYVVTYLVTRHLGRTLALLNTDFDPRGHLKGFSLYGWEENLGNTQSRKLRHPGLVRMVCNI